MAYSELPWRPFLGHQAWSWTTLRRCDVFYYVYKLFFYFCHVLHFLTFFYFYLNVFLYLTWHTETLLAQHDVAQAWRATDAVPDCSNSLTRPSSLPRARQRILWLSRQASAECIAWSSDCLVVRHWLPDRHRQWCATHYNISVKLLRQQQQLLLLPFNGLFARTTWLG